MTTHRRYFFQHPVEIADVHQLAKNLLHHMCQKYWWYNEPEVTGAPFNRLTFSFEVCARDQWFAHKRAMWLAIRTYEAMGMAEYRVPTPMWETLPPHENRGRYRVETQ